MKFGVTFILLLSLHAQAQRFFDIDIEGTQYSTNWSDPEKDIVKQLLENFEKEGSDAIESIDTGTFLEDTVNSQILTHSLMGTDHANDFKRFLIGGTVTAAIDIQGKSLGDAISGNVKGDEVKGAAPNASIIVGFNINRKTQVFLNGMSYKFKKDEFNLGTKSFGLRLRRQILGGIYKTEKKVKEIKTKEGKTEEVISYELIKKPAIFRWGGLKANIGLQYSNLDITYNKELNLSDEISNAGVTVKGSLDSTLSANVNVKSITVPVEVSTYLDLLYVLTPYAGIGANISSGSASGNAKLTDPKVDIEKSGGLGTGTATTDANVSFQEKQKAKLFDPKIFLGTQINLGPAKLGVQYDKSLGGNAQSIGATVRIAF